MLCDHETLPSCSVHMGFKLICVLAEHTMLKDVLNKGTYQKIILKVPPLPESMRVVEVLVICPYP